ncbi:MAG: hypothetical protein ACREUB_08840, partial [Burkholderiales bacterium]
WTILRALPAGRWFVPAARVLSLGLADLALALLAARHANTVLDAAELDAQSVLELFNTVDAWRRPERFAELATAAFAGEPDAGPAQARLERARTAAAAVNAGEIAKSSKNTMAIRGDVDAARLEAIRHALKSD